MQLHWFHPMQSTELTRQDATVYLGNKNLCNYVPKYATAYPTFRQEKAIKNDIMTNAYHDVVTTYFLDIPAPTPWFKLLKVYII